MGTEKNGAARQVELMPLGRMLTVRRLDDTETARPGARIIIPDASQELSRIAEVLAIGDRVKSERLRPGVRVVIGRYAGSEVPIMGETVLLVGESEVQGVLV